MMLNEIIVDGAPAIHGRIYVITNKTNGKQYVGQTTRSIPQRFREHLRLQAKCRALESALKKYGADVFSIEQVGDAYSQFELDEMEATFIGRLQTLAPGGYNLRNGGGGAGPMHPETRALMKLNASSEAHHARFNAMKDSPEVKAKQRAAMKRVWPEAAERMKAGAQQPGVQERRIESVRAAYKTPEVLERSRAHLEDVRNRPEVRAARSKHMLNLWQQEGERERRGNAMSKALLGHKKKIDYSPEAKAHRKAIAQARWEDPAYREKMLARLSDPEFLKRRGDAIRAGHARTRAAKAAAAAAEAEAAAK